MNEDLQFLTPKDIAEALRCSLPTARDIMHRLDFPLINHGRKMLVEKSAFLEWARKRHI